VTTYLLAGGGTAGHVNPLLATADEIRRTEPTATIIVIGTSEGLESRLVPQRGYELEVIPRLPFPRRPNKQAITFFPRLNATVRQLVRLINERSVDVVVGFGGYAAAPAYLAARRTKIPLVIHEANAKPGLANKLGARGTRSVGVVFAGTPLSHATVVGLPLRAEIAELAASLDSQAAARREALSLFGLDPDRATLVVTGGSLGAQRINTAIAGAAERLVASGAQILHIWGDKADFVDPEIPHYRVLRYCDRMELALAVADLAVARAGAATVTELSVLGVPAVLVPYAVGNGEQRFNAADLVAAGGAVLSDDATLSSEVVLSTVLPLLTDTERLAGMAAAARATAIPDGASRFAALIREAIGGAASSKPAVSG
jgi:UDP-N-acetylglucosamine--N-acetylmuramyl-(pentapeptide) pyrophosphoryl-undecaprenol N-acetylglucosamine transferase